LIVRIPYVKILEISVDFLFETMYASTIPPYWIRQS